MFSHKYRLLYRNVYNDNWYVNSYGVLTRRFNVEWLCSHDRIFMHDNQELIDYCLYLKTFENYNHLNVLWRKLIWHRRYAGYVDDSNDQRCTSKII